MQYFCKNQARRLKVASSNAINGMDYLEVVSSDQKTLEVHFFNPLPGETGGIPISINSLSEENFIIEGGSRRSEEHTSELQSRPHLVCRLLLEKKKKKKKK